MIINRLVAENILQYRRLELTHLPEKGLIAVSGANESGKTTLGETICLALFGRTFSLEPSEFVKAIRWGEFQSSVILEFTGKRGRRYRVARAFDGDGSHSAQLRCLDNQQSIAQGLMAVNEMIVEVIGFNYNRFIDSFYLAQREIELPHAKSSTVKALVGVAELEHIDTEFEKEIHLFAESITQWEQQISQTQAQLIELDVQPERLVELKQQQQQLQLKLEAGKKACSEKARKLEQSEKSLKQLEQQSKQWFNLESHLAYSQWQEPIEQWNNTLNLIQQQNQNLNLGGIKQWLTQLSSQWQQVGNFINQAKQYQQQLFTLLGEKQQPVADSFLGQKQALAVEHYQWRLQHRRQLLLSIFSFLCLGLMVFIGSVKNQWLVLTQPLLLDAFQALPTFTIPEIAGININQPWLILAMIFAVLSLWSISLMRQKGQKIASIEATQQRLQTDIDVLEQKINQFEEATQSDDLSSQAWIEACQQLLPEDRQVDSNQINLWLETNWHSNQQQWHQLTTELKQQLLQQCQSITTEHQQQQQLFTQDQQSFVEVEQEIEQQQICLAQAKGLQNLINSLQNNVDEKQQQIEIRKIGQQLLKGTCRRIHTRFNTEMRRFMTKVVPLFTEGRYQYLQIADNLEVLVFSSDKNDFVGLQEISTGTHRQLMLSVRLALSQALIASAIHGPQFVVLDEPFAFFDEERIRKAIAVLPKISPELSQIWVISQEFEEDLPFTFHIHCERGQSELTVDGRVPVKLESVVKSEELSSHDSRQMPVSIREAETVEVNANNIET